MKIPVLLAVFCLLDAIHAAAVHGVNGVEIRDPHYTTTKHWQTSKTTAKTTSKTTARTTLKTSAKTSTKITTTCTTSKKTSKTTTASPTTKKASTSPTTTKVATTTSASTTPIITTPVLTTPVITTPVLTTPVITTPSTTLSTTTSSAAPVCANIGSPCLAAAANLCCSGNCDTDSLQCCVPFRGTCDFNGPSGQCCSPYVCGRTNVCVED